MRTSTPGQSNLQTIVLSFDADAAAQVLEGTLRPTDPLLASFGGKALEPEDATNISIGFSLNLDNGFSLTADYYQVDVEDRVVKTFNRAVPDTPEFADVDFNKVAFYTNGLRFYPDIADAFEKADNGHGGALCQKEECTRRSSNVNQAFPKSFFDRLGLVFLLDHYHHLQRAS